MTLQYPPLIIDLETHPLLRRSFRAKKDPSMDAQTLVYIVLGLLFLLSIAAAWLSARTWPVGQVILVYVIFLATGFYVYLSAKSLAVRQRYRTQVERLEVTLRELRAENAALEFGEETDQSGGAKVGGIRQIRNTLHLITLQRGRVWRDAAVAEPAGPEGRLTVAIADPSPHGIQEDTILFAFEQGSVPDGARYLGEFQVVAADPEAGTVTLAPSLDMTGAQRERLTSSQMPWVLYEFLPQDSHDVFASLDEQALREILPADSVDGYLRHGQPAKADDPDDRIEGVLEDGTTAPLEVLRERGELDKVVERRYVRPLRDYQYLFRELSRQRVVDREQIAQVERDTALLQGALERARQDIAYRQDEKQKLDADLEQLRAERDVLKDYLERLDAQVTNVQRALDATLRSNANLLSSLASYQLEISRRLEQQIEATP